MKVWDNNTIMYFIYFTYYMTSRLTVNLLLIIYYLYYDYTLGFTLMLGNLHIEYLLLKFYPVREGLRQIWYALKISLTGSQAHVPQAQTLIEWMTMPCIGDGQSDRKSYSNKGNNQLHIIDQ